MQVVCGHRSNSGISVASSEVSTCGLEWARCVNKGWMSRYSSSYQDNFGGSSAEITIRYRGLNWVNHKSRHSRLSSNVECTKEAQGSVKEWGLPDCQVLARGSWRGYFEIGAAMPVAQVRESGPEVRHPYDKDYCIISRVWGLLPDQGVLSQGCWNDRSRQRGLIKPPVTLTGDEGLWRAAVIPQQRRFTKNEGRLRLPWIY